MLVNPNKRQSSALRFGRQTAFILVTLNSWNATEKTGLRSSNKTPFYQMFLQTSLGKTEMETSLSFDKELNASVKSAWGCSTHTILTRTTRTVEVCRKLYTKKQIIQKLSLASSNTLAYPWAASAAYTRMIPRLWLNYSSLNCIIYIPLSRSDGLLDDSSKVNFMWSGDKFGDIVSECWVGSVRRGIGVLLDVMGAGVSFCSLLTLISM